MHENTFRRYGGDSAPDPAGNLQRPIIPLSWIRGRFTAGGKKGSERGGRVGGSSGNGMKKYGASRFRRIGVSGKERKGGRFLPANF